MLARFRKLCNGFQFQLMLLISLLGLFFFALAGIPPLAGFFGKFLLLKAVIEQGAANRAYYCLAFTALAGVIISIYYYFGVIRAIYWPQTAGDLSPVRISRPIRFAIYACIAGMFYLGLFPGAIVNLAAEAVRILK